MPAGQIGSKVGQVAALLGSDSVVEPLPEPEEEYPELADSEEHLTPTVPDVFAFKYMGDDMITPVLIRLGFSPEEVAGGDT